MIGSNPYLQMMLQRFPSGTAPISSVPGLSQAPGVAGGPGNYFAMPQGGGGGGGGGGHMASMPGAGGGGGQMDPMMMALAMRGGMGGLGGRPQPQNPNDPAMKRWNAMSDSSMDGVLGEGTSGADNKKYFASLPEDRSFLQRVGDAGRAGPMAGLFNLFGS